MAQRKTSLEEAWGPLLKTARGAGVVSLTTDDAVVAFGEGREGVV